MPLKGGKYRVKTTSTGKKVRLHFTEGGEVNEAVNLKNKGARLTPEDFKIDKKRKATYDKG